MNKSRGIWAVIVFKGFREAKQRLAVCHSALFRRRLSAAMLLDVLDVVVAAPGLAGVLVVTPDRAAAREARRRGLRILAEPFAGGLNRAVSAAAEVLAAEGASGMLVLPADVPGLQPSDIARILELHGAGKAVSLVPAHDRAGTNALLVSPPDVVEPGFGGDSFARHLARARVAGLAPVVMALPYLALDIDHPEDCEAFLRQGHQSRSRTFLSRPLVAAKHGPPEQRFFYG